MKLWIDDVRPAPDEYIWCKTAIDAESIITDVEFLNALSQSCISNLAHWKYTTIDLIDIADNACDRVHHSWHYIQILNWLEKTGRNYPIHIHGTNSVKIQNMRAIIQRNGWKEV